MLCLLIAQDQKIIVCLWWTRRDIRFNTGFNSISRNTVSIGFNTVCTEFKIRIQDTVFILNPVRYTIPVSYRTIPVRYRYRTVFRYTVAPLLIRHFFMQGRLRKKEARDFKYLPLKMLWIKLFIKTFIGRGLS